MRDFEKRHVAAVDVQMVGHVKEVVSSLDQRWRSVLKQFRRRHEPFSPGASACVVAAADDLSL